MPRDAISLLKNDHREVQAKLEELTGSTTRAVRKRTTLAAQIARMIEAHTAIEEELFYPALERAAANQEDRKMMAEAREEHKAATVVLQDVERADPSTLQFGGKVKVLCELIDHHVKEEEGTMFKRARRLLSKDQLRDLGDAMAARKEALLGALA